MIREIGQDDIVQCVNVIRESFSTVASEFGFTEENAFDSARKMNCRKMNIGIVEENQVLREWYENYGFLHIETKKFDFFPFTCGYMVKEL